MSYVRSVYGLGDATSDYKSCLAAKASYDAAVKALQTWIATQSSNQAYYASEIARLSTKYKVSYPSSAPRCITKAQKDAAALDCYRSQNVIKGLGLTAAEAAAAAAQAAYQSSPTYMGNYPPCFVAEMPVCYPVAPKPVVPADPGTCVAPTATPSTTAAPQTATTAPATVTTTSAPSASEALFPDTEAAAAPAATQASITGGSSRGGLLVVAGIIAVGGAWLLWKKKKKPAT
jgi:LPXTG-motif cell wall-anchored protein